MNKEHVNAKMSDIKPYPNNPRKNDDAVESVMKSIKQCGYIAPIIVDEDGVILAGHTRYKALQKLGRDVVDVIVVSGLTDEQKKKYRLLDNKTSELALWDFDALTDELKNLDFGDLNLDWNIGLDADVLQTMEDNYNKPYTEEATAKIGDIYQLGNHRLMCGDSTSADDIKALMNGNKAKMLFTSPPYSDIRDYGGNDLSVEILARFIPAYEPYTDIQAVNLGLKYKNGEIIEYWNDYIKLAKDCGYKLTAWNVWYKKAGISIGEQSNPFPLIHEWIFVFSKVKYDLNKTVEKKEKSITNKTEYHQRREKDGSQKMMSYGDRTNKYKKLESVISLTAEHRSNEIGSKHPARFPIALPAEYIKAMTDENDSVIDCFGGSGSTLMACEQLNRNCYMMEISPEYVDMIIDRWEEFTGQKAVKLN